MCVQYCTPNVILQIICIQSKREAALVGVNQRNLLFSLSYCIFKLTANKVFNSKQKQKTGGYFLVYSATFFIQKYVFKTSGGCFLNYSFTFIKLNDFFFNYFSF